MLAPAQLPDSFAAWNRRHGAPSGPAWWNRLMRTRFGTKLDQGRFGLPLPVMRALGPFAFQPNSATRVFEYPWCQSVAGIRPGIKVLEVGAGAAGFQFALAKEGADVVSVDPLIKPPGGTDWTFSAKEFDRLNRAFGGKVRFINDFVENAPIPESSIDVAFSVSVLEHIPRDPLLSLVRRIRDLLKPGGRLVATIDLFLDCAPFTQAPSNRWGTNINVREFIESSGLRMIVGNPGELMGFAEFDPQRISADRAKYLIGNQVMTQCIVLEKA